MLGAAVARTWEESGLLYDFVEHSCPCCLDHSSLIVR